MKRGEDALFNIVFAAFFSTEDAAVFSPGASSEESDHRGISTRQEREAMYRDQSRLQLSEPANARIDYSTKHCSDSYQSNVAL